MIRNSWQWIASVLVVCYGLMSCNAFHGDTSRRFDNFNKSIAIGNWIYELHVENQNEKTGAVPVPATHFYLKATLSIGNSKTKKSLLYSASKDAEDYEAKYKYLAFNSSQDLHIKYNDEIIKPIGYVFEPSNGLSTSERLVYKFMLRKEQYEAMKKNRKHIVYWYTDHLIGLGKICFNVNN